MRTPSALRPCLEPGCPHLTRVSRCLLHGRLYERARVAARPIIYDAAHRRRALAAIAAEPWCHEPGCGRTDDLTADHADPDDPSSELIPKCRGHNTARANRRRFGKAS